MELKTKLSNDARLKLGIPKREKASFSGMAVTVSADELRAMRNPRTQYIDL